MNVNRIIGKIRKRAVRAKAFYKQPCISVFGIIQVPSNALVFSFLFVFGINSDKRVNIVCVGRKLYDMARRRRKPNPRAVIAGTFVLAINSAVGKKIIILEFHYRRNVSGNHAVFQFDFFANVVKNNLLARKERQDGKRQKKRERRFFYKIEFHSAAS